MSKIPKSCSTCEHRSYGRCMYSGFHCDVERKYPDMCGRDFDAWQPRLGVMQRIVFWLRGVEDRND